MLNVINAILRYEWDPNEFGRSGPVNGYMTFAKIITDELSNGWDMDDIARYLSFVREHWMQLPANKLEDRRIAVLIFCASLEFQVADHAQEPDTMAAA